MKPLYAAKGIYLLIVAMVSTLAANAQTALEFASGGGPTGPGPSNALQMVTFKNNTNNPTGNTFTAYSTPPITTTFSFTNQQYTLPTWQISTGLPMAFGAAINNSGAKALNASLYVQMSSLGSPSNGNFTSVETVSAGTGISTPNNYATEFMVSAMPMYNNSLPTNGRYYLGDMNIVFSTPLTDPVIHLVGIGATYSTLGFTSEFDLSTPGVVLSELSGSGELAVAGNKILNTTSHPNATTGAGAASGSILAKGTNISSLTFKVYLQGDGGATTWATSTSHSGDQMLIAVSTNVPVIVLPVNFKTFTASAQSGTTLLQWTTASENNTSFFDIQHSTDELNWQSIGAVHAAGNTSTTRKYTFVHPSPAPGNNYYRLRIVDLDNRASWSVILEQSFTRSTPIMVYPNPTKGSITITGNGTPLTAVTVMSLDGRPMQQFENFVSGNSIQLSQYPTGIYLISVKDNTGKTQVVKVFRE
ncbi:T9SS type A sorting domain-containing protein [Puia sp.]|uniref:T9SS type A sorting domain-containing protein n=1 Tax=Puia sp. TaxID=2045100 RepID=UPI002F3FFF02